MALAIASKLLTALREAVERAVPRARVLRDSVPPPVQRMAKRGLRALASRSKTAAWLLDRAQSVLDPVSAPVREPARVTVSVPVDAGVVSEASVVFIDEPSPPAEPEPAPPRSLDELAYALRSVSAEHCVAAIADLTDRGGFEASALLLDVLEDNSGFFITVTRLAAARGLQRFAHVDVLRVDRLIQKEQDYAVWEALKVVAAALPRS